MLDELQKLMNFRPVSSDQTAVGQLLDYIEGHLRAKNIAVTRIEHCGIKSLYASISGQKHARVMLQGHVDTVPGGDVFRRDGDTIYGRGCYDMLFAVASYIFLIDTADDLSRYDISLLLTGDEELGGGNGIGTILDSEGYSCDICIQPDAGDSFGAMSVAAKGIYEIEIVIHGTSHHGSRPWEGDGAAAKLIRFLNEFTATFDMSDHDNSTMVITKLAAGSGALNQAPADAAAGIDIRYKDQPDLERVEAELTALLQKYHGEITFENRGQNFALNTDNEFIKKFIAIYEKAVGKPIECTKSYGSTDGRFFDAKGMPVIMFRPNGGNAHGDGEWLSYASWQQFHAVLEQYINDTAVTHSTSTNPSL